MDRVVAEAALAHTGGVEGAYLRSDLCALPPREVMQAWADYLGG